MTLENNDKTTVSDETIEVSEDQLVKQIDTYTSEKLVDIVVMHQYLGLYPKLSTEAMVELAERRSKGDEFKYEEQIATNLAAMPALSLPTTNTVSNLFQKIIKIL